MVNNLRCVWSSWGCWCVLQVLVVWDVSISKARNYRLFEEVKQERRSPPSPHTPFYASCGEQSWPTCVFQDGLMFLDKEVTFPDLAALIEHYYSHPLPHHGSLCLQKPFANQLT